MGPFERQPDGSVVVLLRSVEAQAVRHIATDLVEELVDPADPGLRRLFPPAYEDDAAAERDYQLMTRDDLERRKAAACGTVLRTIDEGTDRRGRFTATLDPDAVGAWLGVLVDARLVLGTRLDVTEDMYQEPPRRDRPDAALFELYLYLGALEEALVETLSEAEPDEVAGTGGRPDD